MTLTILPRPALARTRHWPYGLLGTLQFLDVATTAWILHTFEGAAEANPITAAIFTGAGLKAGLALLLVLKLAVVVRCGSVPACPVIGEREVGGVEGLVEGVDRHEDGLRTLLRGTG